MKNTILNYLLALVLLFAGCKKNDDNSSSSNGNSSSYISTSLVSKTDSSAVIKASIQLFNGTTILKRGICWGTNTEPVIVSNDTTIVQTGDLTFTSMISNLLPNTTYYARGYIVTTSATEYGNVVSFQTNFALPVVTTLAISNLTYTNVTCSGEVLSTGVGPFFERGICFNIIPNPTIGGGYNYADDSSGVGVFTIDIPNLSLGTTFYMRAYGTNLSGTSYGEEVVFTTPASPYTIGQNYGGGIIFHIDYTGLHGLIAAPTDQGSLPWAPSGFGNLSLGVSGQSNTSILANAIGLGNPNFAATYCESLTLNGYSDWFLPSISELFSLYDNKAVVGGFSGPDYYYWTSNDVAWDATKATIVDFSFQIVNTLEEPKTTPHRVRAVRAF